MRVDQGQLRSELEKDRLASRIHETITVLMNIFELQPPHHLLGFLAVSSDKHANIFWNKSLKDLMTFLHSPYLGKFSCK
jgi:hypothetical protein